MRRPNPATAPDAANPTTLEHGSFADRFCEDRRCRLDEFVPMVLRLCLPRRALPAFWLMGRSKFFDADRELIRAVAGAVAMDQVRNATDDYWSHPANRTWLRRWVGLRLSTLRLRRLAGQYLPIINRGRVRRNQGLPP